MKSDRRGTQRTVHTARGLRVTYSLPSGEWWAAVAGVASRSVVGAEAGRKVVAV